MLSLEPDAWSAHHKAIDFDFVNANYRSGVIGGAGLFHPVFEPFWRLVDAKCRIPLIIWGVGVCFTDARLQEGRPLAVDRAVVRAVAERCDLVNVRDDITAEYYGFTHASISACPTIVYLQERRHEVRPRRGLLLYSAHTELVSKEETRRLAELLRLYAARVQYTDNVQTPQVGLDDLIRQYYCRSEAVVTTRLHGAITAYALGIPYLSVARDEKLRAFQRLYGNGLVTDEIAQVPAMLRGLTTLRPQPIALEPVMNFGNRARQWVQDH